MLVKEMIEKLNALTDEQKELPLMQFFGGDYFDCEEPEEENIAVGEEETELIITI